MPNRNKYKTRLARFFALTLLLPAVTNAGEASSLSYEPYAKALAAYVNDDGLVDYAGLKANRAGLDTFVSSLADLDPAVVEKWSSDERFALWMNAYNALTLTAVVDHYPVDSIRDIGSLLRSVWDKLKFNVAGQTLTLNQIEHEILRKDFKDARLHMAINCASIGCPPLGNEPLMAGRLDEQFKSLTDRFLADPDKFRIDREKGIVYLSSIFDWFGDDFTAAYAAAHRRPKFDDKENGVLNFITGHLSQTDRAYLDGGDFKIKHLDYDWNLNRQ